MQNFIDENPILLREKAAAAYCAGDTEKAELFDALADALDLTEALDLAESQADKIAELEKELETRADYSDYKEFFHDCFARLDGHYPCPEVTSAYDCSIIFDAIENGESNNAQN